MKILVATPCAHSMVRQEYLTSMLAETFNAPERLANQEKYDIGFYTTAGYSGLGRDRGVIASYALRNNVDKLFFIDNDMRWKWEDCRKLLDSKRPIIAGVAPLKKYPIRLNFTPLPTDSDCFTDDQDSVTPVGLEVWWEKHERAVEIRVTATGTAFMVIDRVVLEKMVEREVAPPFYFNDLQSGKRAVCWDFFQTGVEEGIYLGEDWGFCVQAARIGFETWVNPSVQVDHCGDHIYQVYGEVGVVPRVSDSANNAL